MFYVILSGKCAVHVLTESDSARETRRAQKRHDENKRARAKDAARRLSDVAETAKRLSRSGPDMKPFRNSAAGADGAAGEKEGEAVGGETGGGEVAESEKPPLPAKGGANLIDAAKRMAGIAQAKRLAAAQRRKIRSLTTIQRRGNKVAEQDAGAAFGELALMCVEAVYTGEASPRHHHHARIAVAGTGSHASRR